MTGWTEFILAWVMFIATHFLPSRRGLRDQLIAVLGRRTYFAAYGIVSLLVLVWLIAAAGRAPHVALWWQAEWQRWVPNLVVPVAAVLAAWGMRTPYPFTLGGRRASTFDPQKPGVAAVSRHPLLWALTLWSLTHLVPNGDLAHVILFGSFGLMALASMPIFDRRARAALSPEQFAELKRSTSALSLVPFGNRAWLARNARPLLTQAAMGLLVYAVFYVLHAPVIGATPVPH